MQSVKTKYNKSIEEYRERNERLINERDQLKEKLKELSMGGQMHESSTRNRGNITFEDYNEMKDKIAYLTTKLTLSREDNKGTARRYDSKSKSG